MYVCMYVRTYVRTYVCMYVYLCYMFIYICDHIFDICNVDIIYNYVIHGYKTIRVNQYRWALGVYSRE